MVKLKTFISYTQMIIKFLLNNHDTSSCFFARASFSISFASIVSISSYKSQESVTVSYFTDTVTSPNSLSLNGWIHEVSLFVFFCVQNITGFSKNIPLFHLVKGCDSQTNNTFLSVSYIGCYNYVELKFYNH